MTRLFTLTLKELRQMFLSPIAYVFLAIFVAFVNVMFFRGFFLRGQATLAQLILRAAECGSDIASPDILKRYEMIHMRATRPLYHGTNALVRLFTDERAPARLLRNGVLQASRMLPPVKWLIQAKLGEMNEPPSLLKILPPLRRPLG